MQVNLEHLIDALAFSLHSWKAIRRAENIIEVVMKHVKVIKDVGCLGKPLGERRRDLGKEWHELPLQRWIV